MSKTRSPLAGKSGESRADAVLDKLWGEGRPPSVRRLAESLGAIDLNRLLDVLRTDQERRWINDQRVGVPQYLSHFPQLATDLEAVFELVYSEWLLREERGETPTQAEYVDLFPDLAERLRMQLEVHWGLPFDDPGLDLEITSTEHDVGESEGGPGDGFDHVPHLPGYEFHGELGRGGMGVVYRAVQLLPRREVALKMILSGVLASNLDRVRFQNEAEAVAALDHPNIVPILELGQHRGLLYFSMRLIGGGSLAECLGRFRDDYRGIANLILQIASAIQHAHERGLLHRDLKPANILLDESGRPYVTDFGLAKRTRGDSELTRTGWFIGSPGYMAPEQTGGTTSVVTTATDVYGLGAILYSLLTGRPPFEGRTVQETINDLRDRLPEPPTRLNPKTPKALEVICLKCLEKDPSRRYSSTEALSADLKRWLSGMPISAKPAGLCERVRLWIRRSPTQAALSGALAAAVLAGFIVSGMMWYRAEANLRIAKISARNERDAKLRALSRFSLALTAIKDVYKRDKGVVLNPEPDLDGSRRKIYRQAGEYYKKLKASLANDPTPEAREQLASAYVELGALTLENDSKNSRDEASAAFDMAIAIRRELAAATPGDPYLAFNFAVTFYQRGLSERDQLLPEVALRSFERARGLLQSLTNKPQVRERALVELSWCIGNMATIELRRRNLETALRDHERVKEIREQLRREYPDSLSHKLDYAWVLYDIAITHNAAKRIDLALISARLASDEFDAIVRANPTHLDALNRCVHSMHYRASCEGNSKNLEAMVKASRRAIAVAEDLARLSGDDPRKTELLASLYRAHAGRLLKTNDHKAARVARARAIVRYERLLNAYPGVLRLQTALASLYSDQGDVDFEAGESRSCLALFQKSLEIRRAILLSNPRTDRVLAPIVDLELLCGIMHHRLGDEKEAVHALDSALSQRAQLARSYPKIQYNVACLLARLSQSQKDPHKADRAMTELLRAASGGFRDLRQYVTDPDLKPLSDRKDFQELLLDLGFPNDPFRR